MQWLLFAALLILRFQATYASCNLTLSDWDRIKVALSLRNFYANFSDAGDCDPSNPNGLRGKYGGCALTLGAVVAERHLEPDGNCSAALAQVLFSGDGRTEAQVLSAADTICNAYTFANTISDESKVGYFCYPLRVYGCPTGIDG